MTAIHFGAAKVSTSAEMCKKKSRKSVNYCEYVNMYAIPRAG